MLRRLIPLTIAVIAGIAIANLVPRLMAIGLHSQHDRHAHEGKSGHEKHPEKHDGKPRAEGAIVIHDGQIAAGEISVDPVGSGTIVSRLTVPGTVAPDANRIARIAAKVVGTVSEMRKQLGDVVAKGDVVAILDSREVAEAKSEYITAQANLELQRTLFEREQILMQSKTVAENQFLRTRNAFLETELKSALSRQKLSALGIADQDIASLSRQTPGLQRYEIRSPIDGRIVERLVDLGAPVGGEGHAKEIYVIADLSSVWIELIVPIADLAAIKEGQAITLANDALSLPSPANGAGSGTAKTTHGKVIFISPMVNAETRSVRVIASIDNADFTWRPGSYVTVRVVTGEHAVALRVPRSALQTVEGQLVVFVRTTDGFEMRPIAIGIGDDQAVEVTIGLMEGERIATTNSFVLKAELSKSEAGHAH